MFTCNRNGLLLGGFYRNTAGQTHRLWTADRRLAVRFTSHAQAQRCAQLYGARVECDR